MPFVPTFGAKLHELVSSGHDCIGWSEDGAHVWVTNPERLARDVIPRFFGHCSYPSLSRSLHAHSFTISPGSNNTWHHMSFRRDAPALAKTIMRKRPKPNERRRPEAPQDPHVSRAPNAESALARLCEELREEEQAGETLMLTLERLQASLSSAHAQEAMLVRVRLLLELLVEAHAQSGGGGGGALSVAEAAGTAREAPARGPPLRNSAAAGVEAGAASLAMMGCGGGGGGGGGCGGGGGGTQRSALLALQAAAACRTAASEALSVAEPPVVAALSLMALSRSSSIGSSGSGSRSTSSGASRAAGSSSDGGGGSSSDSGSVSGDGGDGSVKGAPSPRRPFRRSTSGAGAAAAAGGSGGGGGGVPSTPEKHALSCKRTLGCGRPLGHTGPCGSAVLIGKRARVLTAKAREAMAGDSE